MTHTSYVAAVAAALEAAGVPVERWHADPNEPRDAAITLTGQEPGEQRAAGWNEESGWMYGTGRDGEGLDLIWWLGGGVLPHPDDVVAAVRACLAGDYSAASINRPFYRSFEDDDDLDERLAAIAPLKVATFTAGPPLREGGIPIYAISYSENGREVNRGFARGDQLDDWRNDLTAAGWSVEIVSPDAAS